MPQLKGIITLDTDGDTAIYYGDARYVVTKAAAQVGDIVRSDTCSFSDVAQGAYYPVIDERDGDGVYVDDAGDFRQLAIDTDSHLGFYNSYPDDFTVFRRAEEPAVTPPTTAQLIEQKRAELAELERALAEEIASKRPVVGSYALVTDDFGDNFGEGAIVRVIADDGTSTPFKTVPALLSDDTDAYIWYEEAVIERLTPAEAKAALLAQVEALFSGEDV